MLSPDPPHARLVLRKRVDAVATLEDVERQQLAQIVAQRKNLGEMANHPVTLWTLVSDDASWDVWFFGRGEGAIFAKDETSTILASIEGYRMGREHAELEELLRVAQRRQHHLQPEHDDLVHVTPLMNGRASAPPQVPVNSVVRGLGGGAVKVRVRRKVVA